jgi:hypothetical protein
VVSRKGASSSKKRLTSRPLKGELSSNQSIQDACVNLRAIESGAFIPPDRECGTGTHRIFLLSPAKISGIRGSQITGESAQSSLALRIRNQGAPLGEIFSFISGLYFRGKLAYARRFAEVAGNLPPAYVITACAGLVSSEMTVTLEELREMCKGDVDAANRRYRNALDRDLKALACQIEDDCQVVLLGSVATSKYVEPLLAVFGERLLFPAEFVGRGDMSRGGLMLRCVTAGTQLTYVPLAGAARHGARPPRLLPGRSQQA